MKHLLRPLRVLVALAMHALCMAPAQTLPTPLYAPVTANASTGVLRTPTTFWTANNLAIASASTKGTIVTANYTASAGETVLVDSSAGSFTITLPAPVLGAFVRIKDAGDNLATYNVTVNRSSAVTLATLNVSGTDVSWHCTATATNSGGGTWVRTKAKADDVMMLDTTTNVITDAEYLINQRALKRDLYQSRLPRTASRLSAIDEGLTGTKAQVRFMALGDSLGPRLAIHLVPMLINRYGYAGFFTPTHQLAAISSYVNPASGGVFYPGAEDFTVSPLGMGVRLSGSTHRVTVESYDGTPTSRGGFSPNITATPTPIYSADRVVIVGKAHGPATGGTYTVWSSVDNSSFTQVGGTQTVTSSTSAQSVTLTITAQTIRSVRVIWASGDFVITHVGAHSTTTPGIIFCANSRGGQTLANMAGAADAQSVVNLFAPDVVTLIGRNDSLANMAAAWTTFEALFTNTPTAPDRIYQTIPQASGDSAADPTNSRNILIKQRRAAYGSGILIDLVPYQFGSYTEGTAYTNSNTAGLQLDGTHTNDLFWRMAAGDAAQAFGMSMGSIMRTFMTMRDTRIAGNLFFMVAGNGIQIREGTNGRMGQNTLTSGTVTVANTSVTTSSRVQITRGALNGSTAIGDIRYTITPNTSITFTSTRAATLATETGDASTFDWVLVEAAAATVN